MERKTCNGKRRKDRVVKRGEPYDAKIAKGDGIDVYMFRSTERK